MHPPLDPDRRGAPDGFASQRARSSAAPSFRRCGTSIAPTTSRFTFTSDELNGETRDNKGNPRPLLPRTFTNLSQAEEENGQSRIYLGIHWSFDKTQGIVQGNRIANYVFANAFRRR